jgi:hypothetical protein
MIIKTEYIPLLQVLSFLASFAPTPKYTTGDARTDGKSDDDETRHLQRSRSTLQLIHSRTIHAIPSRATGNNGILERVCVADEVDLGPMAIE